MIFFQTYKSQSKVCEYKPSNNHWIAHNKCNIAIVIHVHFTQKQKKNGEMKCGYCTDATDAWNQVCQNELIFFLLNPGCQGYTKK